MTRAIASALLVALAGCAPGDDGPLTVSDATVYLPLTPNGMSVAYMTLNNHTPNSIVVSEFHSEDYARVELHETTLDAGLARMVPLSELPIPPESSVSLKAGGKHLMLMRPRSGLEAGELVSIELRAADGTTAEVRARLEARVPRD